LRRSSLIVLDKLTDTNELVGACLILADSLPRKASLNVRSAPAKSPRWYFVAPSLYADAHAVELSSNEALKPDGKAMVALKA
jgi:hypothetical protein